MDALTQDENDPLINEPFCCRLRVGTLKEKGTLRDLSFSSGWFGSDHLISFKVVSNAGEYLEYNGETTLKRMDGNFQVIEIIEGVGKALNVQELALSNAFTMHYGMDKGSDLSLVLTVTRTARIYKF
jgi:hypothetical protein